ncbi:E3 ubiquitin-protein ligase LRSAM1-like isoform X2 [Limulus polyphemus]|uniref:E3 ubiquitin-protein ligase LRSAM1-like isoform X2 n=1 Tax=Limulus polyphemus TaxID=6850 RepID=A0ABM1SZ31_LIMPO|nr:E3 ubiquitin-protein ligase LRSAM1-like isoform X2 [Limulus polyphemus]
MPLFKKNQAGKEMNYKARLEHKLCVAKDNPDETFDLAECNMTEVPSGVFTMCRVFRKHVLLLQKNQLTTLNGGGSLNELQELKVLDLHSNKLPTLTDDIGLLRNLQELNLSDNKLKRLPESFSCLKALKTLSLRDICRGGTESIMKFLCSENGTEYVPPDQLKTEMYGLCKTGEKCTSTQNHRPSWSESDFPERRKQDLLQMEEAMRQTQENQALAAAETMQRRQQLLEDVANEQDRMQEEIGLIQIKKDREKQFLLSSLSQLEDHSTQLIEQLLTLNDKVNNKDLLLEALEKEKQEIEELFTVKKEEQENLHKKHILESMTDLLRNEEQQRESQANKQKVMKDMQESSFAADKKIEEILTSRDQDQQVLLSELLKEEHYQKEAFKTLQLKRDEKHNELTQRIKLIEKELTKLTGVELKKKDLKVNFAMNTLAEKRTILAQLLAELYEQRQNREKELIKRIHEMEERRAGEIQDYWLIQFQKLLDRKPQELIDKELAVDPVVKEIFVNAGAQGYITLFATKNITVDQLIKMSEKDLSKLGVTNSTVRMAIMNAIFDYQKKGSPAKKLDVEGEEKYRPSKAIEAPAEPSAPPAEEEEALEPAIPSAPVLTDQDVKLWTSTECVVCLENKSAVVFLPCGHVCCCWICVKPLTSCPMCRSNIHNKLCLGNS